MPRPLRIFLACQQSAVRHAVPAYAFWADYFRHAIAEAGHTCLEAPVCDWAAGLRPAETLASESWPDRTWTSALDYIRHEHSRQPIDFFLGYLFPQQVLPAAVSEIRALGIPCVNFFCDNVREFRRVPAAFRAFDLHWVPEFNALPLYARDRLPVLHAPMPCWVPPAQRVPASRETLPPTFVGTRDELRAHLFADAFLLGLSADLRGYGWDGTTPPPPAPAASPGGLLRNQWHFLRRHGPRALGRKLAHRLMPPTPFTFDFSAHVRPMPVGDDYARILRESSVCLGVNRYPSPRFPLDNPDTYSRLRDLEAPMSGACYLTECAPGLDTLYDLGNEIETYRTADELVEKSRALVADPVRRARLRAAGQRRALADHPILRTLARIAEHLRCSSR